MQAVLNIFRPVLLYVERAFEFNKYLAGAGLAVFITVALFFLMVALISLGDTGIKTDNARKLADVIMPDRDIDTLYDDFEKPEEPDQQPEDIAQPELDLAPIEGVDVAIPKPKTNFAAGGGFFRDGEYIPLFKVTPIYPRRAQERGIQGYSIVAFTITETGTVEDVVPLEGFCGDPTDPATEYRKCSIFNSAASRAALKLKYKPKIVDGNAVKVYDVPHKFTFILEDL
ncbi:energy transducer TonB [SAR86 cluster bacterium]|jgi:protein TonB|nr:energy transducer TonB [SAR86 cluster bacterium]URQ72157.1 energy transducer TonB [SAR86 cluster bacterium]GIS02997.1 MAG: protein TonB [Gammaproteobacteria bacterium]|tara:strand:+ start:3513 stop:4196 length:684 start_codon:yes stop_codon:yes gene_type:complete